MFGDTIEPKENEGMEGVGPPTVHDSQDGNVVEKTAGVGREDDDEASIEGTTGRPKDRQEEVRQQG